MRRKFPLYDLNFIICGLYYQPLHRKWRPLGFQKIVNKKRGTISDNSSFWNHPVQINAHIHIYFYFQTQKLINFSRKLGVGKILKFLLNIISLLSLVFNLLIRKILENRNAINHGKSRRSFRVFLVPHLRASWKSPCLDIILV